MSKYDPYISKIGGKTIEDSPYWLQQVMPKPPSDPGLLSTRLNDRNAIRFDSKIKLPYDCGTVTIESTGVGCYLYIKDQFRNGFPFVNLLRPDQRTATFELGEWRRSYCDPLGLSMAHLICTNSGVGSIKITFNTKSGQSEAITVSAEQKFTAVRLGIVPDYDRDGIISGNDRQEAFSNRTFSFWINDDKDVGDICEYALISKNSSDLPGQTEGNYNDLIVNGHADLLDFTPIWLDMGEVLNVLGDKNGITYNLSQGDSAVKIAWTFLLTDEAGSYQKQTAEGQDLASTQVSLVHQSGILTVPPVYLAATKFNPKFGIVLLEGCTATTRPLALEVRRNNEVLLRQELSLRISPVEDMYRWINLRAITGDTVARPTTVAQPLNRLDSEGNNKHFVFVHGYNIHEQDARAWNAEMFKRLFQSGSKAMYTAVTWRGNQGQVWSPAPSPGFYTEDFHSNVRNALLTAPALATAVADLPGTKIIAAHSLGNMVVTSAIQEYGMVVDKFYALNAAVASETIDPSTYSIATDSRMVHDDWRAYVPQTWASRWYTFFPSTDDRSKLTWKGRFQNVAPHTYNYWSSGDEVLELNMSGSTWASTGEEFRQYAWHKQEILKGRSAVGGTTWAGWGFGNPMYENITWSPSTGTIIEMLPYYPNAAAANNAPQSQLRDIPVFKQTPSVMFRHPISTNNLCELLACAIPALSQSMGGRFVPNIGEQFNRDMNNTEDVVRPNNWPRNHEDYGARWLHNDVKEVAFFYVYPLFDDFVSKGGLSQ